MSFALIAFLALPLSLNVCGAHSKIPLLLAGVFDIETKPGDENSASMVPIVTMAIRHVNSCPKILVDYDLRMQVMDVKCDDSHAIHAFTEYIRDASKKIMIIGPGCSKSAEPLAKAAHFYNLVHVSVASANPALTCKKAFPTFITTIPPEHLQNEGRVALVKHFNWRRVTVLREGLDTFSGLANDLVTRLKDAGVSICSYETFNGDPDLQLNSIKEKDARVIFGIFSEKTARNVICKAYKKGFYGPKIVWIMMSGGYRESWEACHDTNCTVEEIRHALGNYLSTKALMIGEDNEKTVAEKTVPELWKEYQIELQHSNISHKEPSRYAAFAYDAVWTIALTLSQSITVLKQQNETKNMSLKDFDYDNVEMRKTFMNVAKGISFKGMSVLVQFHNNSNRLSLLVIDQKQGNVMKRIGTYSMKEKIIIVEKGQTALWEENKVPVCTIESVRVPLCISRGLVYTMDSFCIVGLAMAVGLFLFNFKHRNVRFIKMSSPNLNNIIIFGCICIYVCGLLFGVDGQMLSAQTHTRICQARAWTASMGFTMAFGALFSKTWRVHRIFMNKTKKTVIQDSQLFAVVLILLAADASILITWQLSDPVYTFIMESPKSINSKEDIALYPYQARCTSNHESLWTGMLYGFKGFILLFGTYLVWETRKVHISALNDSKQIGMAVYNVLIPCAIVIPVLALLKNHTDAGYFLTVLLCVFCTTVTQCLIFVPKILVMRGPQEKLKEHESCSIPSTNSFGAKISTVTQVEPLPSLDNR